MDTTVWVAALRDATCWPARHLAELVQADEVIVPAPVRLELLAGASQRNVAALIEGFEGVRVAVPSQATWQQLEAWVVKAVAVGQRFAVVDLLIGATAAEHDAPVWSLDADFTRMEQLGFVAVYAAS